MDTLKRVVRRLTSQRAQQIEEEVRDYMKLNGLPASELLIVDHAGKLYVIRKEDESAVLKDLIGFTACEVEQVTK